MATSITKGRAGNAATVDNADWSDILPTTGVNHGCEEIVISVPVGSAVGLRVGVQHNDVNDSCHPFSGATPSNYAIIPVGGSLPFAGSIENKIKRIRVAGDGGTATFSWTVTKP